MPSDTMAGEAYVWIWLPGATEPVVAGRVVEAGGAYAFTYGQSYRARPRAIPLTPIDLPLEPGTFMPSGMSPMHAALRDAGPDAWGRRVLGHRHPGRSLSELDYLLLATSDRIGALDFQLRGDVHEAREAGPATLADLLGAAEIVAAGGALPAALEVALLHGSSVGGARPKALLQDAGRWLLAKFGSSTDPYDVVKAEFSAMRLAARLGIDVPRVELRRVLGKDVMLSERFDRVVKPAGVTRRHVLSALGLLGLDEMEARYASYPDLADVIRHRFADPATTLRELFRRLCFNVLVGNTDDHARNHAAFWDGEALRLTPAYDLVPQLRAGRTASQGMAIGGAAGNASTLANVLSIRESFLLGREEAVSLIEELALGVRSGWEAACDEAGMPPAERARLRETAVLNPFCFEGWPA